MTVRFLLCCVMWQNHPNCSVSDGENNLEHSDWGDVVRKLDCSVLHPLSVNAPFAIVLGLICAFGFPLNFEIIYRIVYDKVLRRKSRYVIQLFSTASSLLTFLTNVVQICYFVFRRFDQASEHLCWIYVSIIGLSQGTFFLNLLASLIDSFVSTNFSNWHKKKVTPRRVVFGLSVLNLALIVAMKWVFIGQGLPIVCAIQVLHARNVQIPTISLFISSIFFLFLNFFSVWRLLPRASRANPTANRRQQQPEEIEMRQVGAALAVIDEADEQESIHSPLRRLELKTTKLFLFTIIPLLLFPLPPIIFAMSCFYSSHPSGYCQDLTWIIPYIPIAFCLYTLVGPIMNLLFNKDFAPHGVSRRYALYFLFGYSFFQGFSYLILAMS